MVRPPHTAQSYHGRITRLMLHDFDYNFNSRPGLRFICPWCAEQRGRPDEIQRHMRLQCVHRARYPSVVSAGILDYSLLGVELNDVRLTADQYRNILRQQFIGNNTALQATAPAVIPQAPTTQGMNSAPIVAAPVIAPPAQVQTQPDQAFNFNALPYTTTHNNPYAAVPTTHQNAYTQQTPNFDHNTNFQGPNANTSTDTNMHSNFRFNNHPAAVAGLNTNTDTNTDPSTNYDPNYDLDFDISNYDPLQYFSFGGGDDEDDNDTQSQGQGPSHGRI